MKHATSNVPPTDAGDRVPIDVFLVKIRNTEIVVFRTVTRIRGKSRINGVGVFLHCTRGTS